MIQPQVLAIAWRGIMETINTDFYNKHGWDAPSAVYAVTLKTVAESPDGVNIADFAIHFVYKEQGVSVESILLEMQRHGSLHPGVLGVLLIYEGYVYPRDVPMPRNKEEAEYMHSRCAPYDHPRRQRMRMVEVLLRDGKHYMLMQREGEEQTEFADQGENVNSPVVHAARTLLAQHMN